MKSYTIILFYIYTHIENPAELMLQQRALCSRLGLKGRGIIAHEGLNFTLEGQSQSIDEYCNLLLSDPRFAKIHIKRSVGTGSAFPKLSIKVRKEIVTLGLPATADIDPTTMTGKHLPAEELKQWFDKNEDFVIVDMRNTYEHKTGHFKDSVLPPLENFRDLPKAFPELEKFKNKKVLTVCTGGVRCEKASGFLVKNGFSDVYQLDGGIVTYMEKFKDNQEFRGSLYVFDDRVTMAFADAKVRGIIGTCDICKNPSEHYVNCADPMCHRHFIACEKCSDNNSGNTFCNDICRGKALVGQQEIAA